MSWSESFLLLLLRLLLGLPLLALRLVARFLFERREAFSPKGVQDRAEILVCVLDAVDRRPGHPIGERLAAEAHTIDHGVAGPIDPHADRRLERCRQRPETVSALSVLALVLTALRRRTCVGICRRPALRSLCPLRGLQGGQQQLLRRFQWACASAVAGDGKGACELEGPRDPLLLGAHDLLDGQEPARAVQLQRAGLKRSVAQPLPGPALTAEEAAVGRDQQRV
mmetsp:Transcript_43022/g.133743  ORF Transcript_43022/g.133743 Transcript_43022/m.133743 type:complete len:225 (+) Transcript_43022:53-727(+)